MRFFLLLAFLSSFVWGQGFQTYSTEVGSGVTIGYKIIFNSASTSRPGARIPMQVRISNKTNETLSWSFQAKDGWGEMSDSEFNTSFTVESKATRTYTLNLPYNSTGGDDYFYSPSFKIKGPGVDVRSNIRPFGEQLNSGKVCSKAAYKKIQLYSEQERKKKQSQHSSSRSSAYMLDYEYSYFDTQNLSADWQSYSGITEILMTSGEFQLLQAEVKTALRDWAISGGMLILADPANEMDKVKINSFFKNQGNLGLGMVHILAAGTRPDSLKRGKQRTAENFVYLQRANFIKKITEPKASFIFFSFLLVIFLILLIPVNLFIFVKKNRLKLLITTPLISLVASVVFFVVIIFSDGFGGRGVKSSLVYINPELKRCSILQSQVSRMGIVGSKNFDTEQDYLMEVYSMSRERWEKTDYPIKSKVVFNDESIGGDIFNSRTRRFADIRHVQSTQASIELLEGVEIQVRSSFQSPINKIYIRTHSGKYFQAEDLEPGELVSAVALSKIEKTEIASKLQSLMKGDKSGFFAELQDAGEFDIPTHSSVKWKEHQVYAVGSVVEVKK